MKYKIYLPNHKGNVKVTCIAYKLNDNVRMSFFEDKSKLDFHKISIVKDVAGLEVEIPDGYEWYYNSNQENVFDIQIELLNSKGICKKIICPVPEVISAISEKCS